MSNYLKHFGLRFVGMIFAIVFIVSTVLFPIAIFVAFMFLGYDGVNKVADFYDKFGDVSYKLLDF